MGELKPAPTFPDREWKELECGHWAPIDTPAVGYYISPTPGDLRKRPLVLCADCRRKYAPSSADLIRK